MTPLRAAAIDIDATLINSAKKIPDFTRDEIRRIVREYGTEIFLVTARGPESARVIVEELGVPCALATYGGALVLDGHGPEAAQLAATALDERLVDAFVNAGMQAGVHVGVYTQDDWYVSELDYWGLREARNTAVWPTVADLVNEADAPGWGPVYKVMFRGEAEALGELNSRLQHYADDAYIHHSRRVLEIVPAAAVKLPALRVLTDHRGIGLDEVIAFGDSAADVEMLESVQVGVIMANATPDLSLAPHVVRTLSHDEDGVGIALRKYFPTSEPFRP